MVSETLGKKLEGSVDRLMISIKNAYRESSSSGGISWDFRLWFPLGGLIQDARPDDVSTVHIDRQHIFTLTENVKSSNHFYSIPSNEVGDLSNTRTLLGKNGRVVKF
jgi:hypothetical protein